MTKFTLTGSRLKVIKVSGFRQRMKTRSGKRILKKRKISSEMTKELLLEIEKRNNELKNIKGSLDDINFGSQIRSYIMCPYTLVKDHRTNVEVTNVNSVLDGNIDVFINSILKEG